ncbi:MAG: hypothetical protein E3J21_24835 [Anaerolineales bacterium]|nr:MAG: hypothetical protein E3J21_24835 [Anaerolineales bacterium]
MNEKNLEEMKKLYELLRALQAPAENREETSPIQKRLAELEAQNAYFSRYEYTGISTPYGR